MNGRELVIEFIRRRDLHFPKSPYVPLWGRDCKILMAIRDVLGENEMFDRVDAYFCDNAEFCMINGWSIPVFKSRVNQYDKLIASQARMLAESRKSRQHMNELPGREREASKSEPHSFESLIKQFINKTE